MSINYFVNSECVQCFRIEDLSLIDAKGGGDVIDPCGHKVSHMGVESFAVSFPDLGVYNRSSIFDVRRYIRKTLKGLKRAFCPLKPLKLCFKAIKSLKIFKTIISLKFLFQFL